MSAVFLRILEMSISASWLILAILIVRPLLKKMPKWGAVLLWGLAGLRLLVPFSIESNFSLIPEGRTNENLQIIEPVELPVLDQPTSTASNVDILSIFSILWIVGVVLLTIYFAISYWRILRKLDTAVLLRENIYQSELILAPIVIGVLNPKICVPFHAEASDLTHIISHEKMHIRRGDHWWKLLAYGALTLHWFNPLVWVAYILLGRDIELACDEAVIQKLNSDDRADYAQALMSCSMGKRSAAVYLLGFGEVGVKTRIKSVMKYRKPTVLGLIFLLAFTVFLSVCFLTNPVKAVDNVVQDIIVQETQQPQEEDATRPTKDLTGIDLEDEPVRAQIAFMQEQLESLKRELIEAQAQYEETEPRFRIPLRDLMDHYEERIEELESQIQRAKKQIGME